MSQEKGSREWTKSTKEKGAKIGINRQLLW